MGTFSVELSVTGYYSTEVEADDEDEAVALAEKKFQEGKKSWPITWLSEIETELHIVEDVSEEEEDSE